MLTRIHGTPALQSPSQPAAAAAAVSEERVRSGDARDARVCRLAHGGAHEGIQVSQAVDAPLLPCGLQARRVREATGRQPRVHQLHHRPQLRR